MLAGILAATSGRVSVAGVEVTPRSQEAKRRLGFLTGTTGLYARLTARELLTYFGRLHGMDAAAVAARIDWIARTLDFTALLDKRCEALSSGNKQRVSVARAVLHDPPVLILDEPTVGLDVLATRFLRDFVRAERDRGKAVIYSTHYLADAELLCDRIGLLHRGRMLAEGSPAALRAMAGGASSLEEAFLTLVAALEGRSRDPRRRRRHDRAARDFATVALVYAKELRETLRDRRTLFVMVLFPLVVYPLMSLLLAQVMASKASKNAAHASRVAVSGVARRDRGAAQGDREPTAPTSRCRRAATTTDVELGRLDALIVVGIAGAGQAGARAAGKTAASVVYDETREPSNQARERIDRLLAGRAAARSASRSTRSPTAASRPAPRSAAISCRRSCRWSWSSWSCWARSTRRSTSPPASASAARWRRSSRRRSIAST